MATGLARGMGAKIGAVMGGGDTSFEGIKYVLTEVQSNTTLDAKTNFVTLPSGGTWDIDWGDGFAETGLTTTDLPSHTYTDTGDYTITFKGDMTFITSPSGSYKQYLTEVISGENGITNFGSYSGFSGWTNLKRVVIPAGVSIIYNQCLYECSGLESIDLQNVGEIRDWGVTNANLKSLHIPKTLYAISTYAFRGALKNADVIDVDVENTTFDSRNDCNAIIGSSNNKLYYGCKNTIVPNSVRSFGDYAFYGCSGLTSINIPVGTTSIGEACFQLVGFSSVVVPSSVTTLSGYAFCECVNLITVDLQCNITALKNWTFGSCKKLRSIVIPDTVVQLGEYVFRGSGITAITLPEGCVSLGYGCFRECTALTTVDLPSTLTVVYGYCFDDCQGMQSITSRSSTPPTLYEGAFSNVPTSIPVYVPSASIAAYQAATGWSSFTNYQAIPE